jgi:saccharopine dehydrogenase-like NADP-dependent oxidoreductase
MRALVLGGAGAVCTETTRDLALYSDFEEIVIADRNLTAAQALAEEIGDPRLSVVHFDADDYAGMLELFSNYDIVINGLPFKYDTIVTKACVELGVNGLDLGSEESQYDLDEEAQEKDMIFVPGVGATPGITNMMVRRASEVLGWIETVEIFFAAFRCLAPAPGLLHTTLWEFNPEEEDREEVYYENGEWHPTPPLSGERVVDFHGQIGEQKVYYVPHDESYSLPQSFTTLRRAAVRGCFPPHVMGLMGSLMRANLLSSRPVRLGEQELPSIEVVRALLAESPACWENPVWGYGLVVEVYGEKAGRRFKCTYRNKHPPQEEWGGPAAYFKNVGIPLAIGAQLIAHGQVTGKGVRPPERALPTAPFFSELARRGIQVEEEIVETGILSET